MAIYEVLNPESVVKSFEVQFTFNRENCTKYLRDEYGTAPIAQKDMGVCPG